jgi:hypothetical protein
VALVAMHALEVGCALFRAQFARELWIEPRRRKALLTGNVYDINMVNVNVINMQGRGSNAETA